MPLTGMAAIFILARPARASCAIGHERCSKASSSGTYRKARLPRACRQCQRRSGLQRAQLRPATACLAQRRDSAQASTGGSDLSRQGLQQRILVRACAGSCARCRPAARGEPVEPDRRDRHPSCSEGSDSVGPGWVQQCGAAIRHVAVQLVSQRLPVSNDSRRPALGSARGTTAMQPDATALRLVPPRAGCCSTSRSIVVGAPAPRARTGRCASGKAQTARNADGARGDRRRRDRWGGRAWSRLCLVGRRTSTPYRSSPSCSMPHDQTASTARPSCST